MKALLIKGNPKIINLPEIKSKADKFYSEIIKVLKKNNLACKIIESDLKGTLKDNVTNDTDILIGHSKGASWIAARYTKESFPNVLAIILFDPLDEYCKRLNEFNLKKLIIASSEEEVKDLKFPNLIKIDDDHYFSSSLKEISKFVENFIKDLN